MRGVWLPQLQNMPGHFANKSEWTFFPNENRSYVLDTTTNSEKAISFRSEAECQDWCNNNDLSKYKSMVFVPVRIV